MITYQLESYSACVDELKSLFYDFWLEVESEYGPPDVDHDQYIRLDEIGNLQVMVARDDAKLIGFMINVINPDRHRQADLIAFSDALYLLPEYRADLTGLHLIHAAKEDLRARKNITSLLVSMKIKHKFTNLLESLEFSKIEEVWELKLWVNPLDS